MFANAGLTLKQVLYMDDGDLTEVRGTLGMSGDFWYFGWGDSGRARSSLEDGGMLAAREVVGWRKTEGLCMTGGRAVWSCEMRIWKH